MTSRRKRGPGITLFAFQDIIMSCAGIMMLIVLLLTLELIERRTEGAVQVRPVAHQSLEQEIAELQQRIAEADLAAQKLSGSLATAATATVWQLKEDLNQRKESLRQLTAESRRAEVEEQSLEESLSGLQQQAQSRSGEEADVARQIEEVAKLQAEIDDLARSGRPLYRFESGDRQRGWIAVLSKDNIQVAQMGVRQAPQTFESQPGLFGTSAAQRFLEWSKSRRAGDGYFFLIVRPDGIECLEKISEEFDRASVDYGIDLTSQDQRILHPERGTVE